MALEKCPGKEGQDDSKDEIKHEADSDHVSLLNFSRAKDKCIRRCGNGQHKCA